MRVKADNLRNIASFELRVMRKPHDRRGELVCTDGTITDIPVDPPEYAGFRFDPDFIEAIVAVRENYFAALEPEMPLLMGILNVTPDSFSDGGRFFSHDAAVARGIEMAEEGADIIDVGGESTRPGAEPVGESEEIGRVLPVIRDLSEELAGRARISIDTSKAAVAAAALEAGASMINDVSALNFDKGMAALAADAGAELVLMHMQGKPRTMQAEPKYDDLLGEIYSFLCNSVLRALDAGVAPGNILVDPGIGFGKTVENNLELLQRLREFTSLGLPVVIGTSRKSMFGSILNYPDPGDRVYATVAAHSVAQLNGAGILRVHDVRAAADGARVVHSIMTGKHL